MSRPPKKQPTVRVVIPGSPKFAAYLDDLISEEGYGSSRPEVAKNLVWRGIERLIEAGVLDRRQGPFDTPQ